VEFNSSILSGIEKDFYLIDLTVIRKENFYRKLEFILCIICFSLAQYLFFTSNYFYINNVIINGKGVIESQQLISLAQIKGRHIYEVWRKRNIITQELSSLPFIKSIKVAFTLPASVIIDYESNTQVGIIKDGDEAFAVDTQGVVLKRVSPEEAEKFIWIDMPLYEKVTIRKKFPQISELTLCCDIIKEFSDEFNKITKFGDKIILWDKRGLKIIIDNASQLEEKLDYIPQILSIGRKNRENISYIDLRFSKQCIFKRKGGKSGRKEK